MDVDEGWRIEIFEDAGWVYVTQNEVTFRVRSEDYLRSWNALIDEFNPVAPLDGGEN